MKNNRIQVAFCSIWHIRGISIHTKQLADALEEFGIDTYICARWESERFSNSGEIKHPRVTNFGDNPSAQTITDWVRENNIDVFIQMEVHPNDWNRLDAIKALGIKIVLYENLDIMRRDSLQNYKSFDFFLCNTFYNYKVFNDLYPESSYFLLPWGVPADQVIQHRIIKHKDSPLVFVHVAGWGGINNRKNTDLVIEAFSDIPENEAILRLYTQNPISHFGPKYENLINSSKSIIVTEGTVDNIMEVYIGADVLLWPSKREGVGLPIIEALASGLSAIVSDGYMMKQWLIRDTHGLICEGYPIENNAYLPEIDVKLKSLRDCISKICNKDLLQSFRNNIKRDKEIWDWSWQKELLSKWITAIVTNKNTEFLEDPQQYLPQFYLQFEKRRIEHENDHLKIGSS